MDSFSRKQLFHSAQNLCIQLVFYFHQQILTKISGLIFDMEILQTIQLILLVIAAVVLIFLSGSIASHYQGGNTSVLGWSAFHFFLLRPRFLSKKYFIRREKN